MPVRFSPVDSSEKEFIAILSASFVSKVFTSTFFNLLSSWSGFVSGLFLGSLSIVFVSLPFLSEAVSVLA